MTTKRPNARLSDEERAHFANRLRSWRTAQGLVIKQAAAHFGVTEATWSRWEKEERFPSPANLRLLASLIGVPICCFFYPGPGTCPHCQASRPENP